jgi:hypothetical protein
MSATSFSWWFVSHSSVVAGREARLKPANEKGLAQSLSTS